MSCSWFARLAIAVSCFVPLSTLAAEPAKRPEREWVQPGEFKGKKILIAGYYWEGSDPHSVPMNHVPKVLEDMGFKVDIRRMPTHLPDLSPYDELWVVSGSGSSFDASDARRIGKFLDAGHGVYVMADNVPYIHEAKVIGETLHGISFDGDYYGGQAIHVIGSGALKKMVDEAMKKGDVDKLVEMRRAGFLNGKLYAEDHELLSGIREIYEGITVAHMTGAQDLEVILRASDNQALVSVSHKPKELIVYDGGFTRLYCGWEENRETSTRWYRNVAAYLLGKKRADLEPVQQGS